MLTVRKTWKSCYAVLEPDLFTINIYAREEDVFMHEIKGGFVSGTVEKAYV